MGGWRPLKKTYRHPRRLNLSTLTTIRPCATVHVMKQSTSLKIFLERHARVLSEAEAMVRSRLMRQKRVTMGDVTARVWLRSGLTVMEWQARAVISHAVRNGAFGNITTKPGVGFSFVQDKAGDRNRRSA